MMPAYQTESVSSPSFTLLQYRYLIFFSMLCMSLMLFNSILTNRYISIGVDNFVLGGTFTSPLFFILIDIVAEIYGYRVARKLIWCGFICQILFALGCLAVIYAPYPDFFKDHEAYTSIFSQLLHISLSSLVAFVIASLSNAYIITKWKVLVQGRYFWLRSLGSSTIAEALYSAIAIIMMEINLIPSNDILKLVLTSYFIKVSYSIILAGPANVLVNYIKRTAKIDVYDAPASFNPFKKSA